MQRRHILACSLALAAPCALSAQNSLVFPAVFTNAEAPSQNTHPLGAAVATSPSMRYLAVHDDMQGRVGALREMGFRLTAGNVGHATNIVMEVVLSTAATTAATMSTTFDLNHGPNKATVVPPNSPFNYPAYPATARGPAPFHFRVPFSSPFPFVGNGPLCWEVRIASRTNTVAFSHDAGSGAYTFFTQILGTGCIATGRTVAAATNTTLAAANLTVSATQLAANAVAIAVLGFNDTTWSGIPLPLLVPGSAGAPSGPCHVWSSMAILQAFLASAAGAGSAVIPTVPASPQWVGLRAYSWVLAFDAAANPLGVVTTSYRELNWGDGLVVGCRRLYAFNNVNAPTGSLDSTAVVVEFLR